MWLRNVIPVPRFDVDFRGAHFFLKRIILKHGHPCTCTADGPFLCHSLRCSLCCVGSDPVHLIRNPRLMACLECPSREAPVSLSLVEGSLFIRQGVWKQYRWESVLWGCCGVISQRVLHRTWVAWTFPQKEAGTMQTHSREHRQGLHLCVGTCGLLQWSKIGSSLTPASLQNLI